MIPAARWTPNTLRRLCLATLAVIALAIAFAPTPASAQGKGPPPKTEQPTRGYTLPYLFTIMAVAAVIAPLCWPAMRRWDLPIHGQEDE